jgi:hypothetical protein
LGALSVGNGEFAFTVDVTGLQTFPEHYENGIPLGTQTQWAWHSNPNPKYSLDDVAKRFESCDGTSAPYAVQNKEGKAAEATNVLRANPHRLHLGLVGFVLLKKDGSVAKPTDIENIRQTLDLWSGKIESNFSIEGTPVKAILYAHQERDGIAAHIESPLIQEGRLKISIKFPYGKECHVCPGYDWNKPEAHSSTLTTNNTATIERTVDTTRYYTQVQFDKATFRELKKHEFELTPESSSTELDLSVQFGQSNVNTVPTFTDTRSNSESNWKEFWSSGGFIDFSQCTDPRAAELERRVILSQYLTRINCAGSLPPQETGLTLNSWYGKFHLEMHWWHATHFALWNKPQHIDKSLSWYNTVMSKAKATARWQGYSGARWQKMTDPYGNESPSSVGAFIIWQQPHPIYLAELLYRNNSDTVVLNKYKDIVFETAEFMTAFLKEKNGRYHLCHPLIPAQEIFHATETDDPGFELQYWYYGLSTAQQWRKRCGLAPEPRWQRALEQLAPLAISNGLYLPNSTTPSAYTDDQFRRDHPAILAAYGFLPWNSRIDTTIMKNTFEEIEKRWQWETTWGWDYPMMAMTAARLNKPESAVNALLMDTQKNTYLVNGHNYQDKRLRLYLPGNGGLLAAVAMMAAGWDGSTKNNPGFPQDGKWNVRWEGLVKMP